MGLDIVTRPALRTAIAPQGIKRKGHFLLMSKTLVTKNAARTISSRMNKYSGPFVKSKRNTSKAAMIKNAIGNKIQNTMCRFFCCMAVPPYSAGMLTRMGAKRH